MCAVLSIKAWYISSTVGNAVILYQCCICAALVIRDIGVEHMKEQAIQKIEKEKCKGPVAEL